MNIWAQRIRDMARILAHDECVQLARLQLFQFTFGQPNTTQSNWCLFYRNDCIEQCHQLETTLLKHIADAANFNLKVRIREAVRQNFTETARKPILDAFPRLHTLGRVTAEFANLGERFTHHNALPRSYESVVTFAVESLESGPHSWTQHHNSRIQAFSRDGALACVGPVVREASCATPGVWVADFFLRDVQTGAIVHEWRGGPQDNANINDGFVALSPSGEHALAALRPSGEYRGSDFARIALWNRRRAEPLAFLPEDVSSLHRVPVVWSSGETMVAIITNQYSIFLVDTERQEVRHIDALHEATSPPSARFSRDGRWVACSDGKHYVLWDRLHPPPYGTAKTWAEADPSQLLSPISPEQQRQRAPERHWLWQQDRELLCVPAFAEHGDELTLVYANRDIVLLSVGSNSTRQIPAAVPPHASALQLSENGRRVAWVLTAPDASDASDAPNTRAHRQPPPQTFEVFDIPTRRVVLSLPLPPGDTATLSPRGTLLLWTSRACGVRSLWRIADPGARLVSPYAYVRPGDADVFAEDDACLVTSNLSDESVPDAERVRVLRVREDGADAGAAGADESVRLVRGAEGRLVWSRTGTEPAFGLCEPFHGYGHSESCHAPPADRDLGHLQPPVDTGRSAGKRPEAGESGSTTATEDHAHRAPSVDDAPATDRNGAAVQGEVAPSSNGRCTSAKERSEDSEIAPDLPQLHVASPTPQRRPFAQSHTPLDRCSVQNSPHGADSSDEYRKGL